MAVLNTTSPTAAPGAPTEIPSSRVPSSRSTNAVPPGTGRSACRSGVLFDKRLYLLELRGAGLAQELEEGGLDTCQDGSASLHLVQAEVAVLGRPRGDCVGCDVN